MITWINFQNEIFDDMSYYKGSSYKMMSQHSPVVGAFDWCAFGLRSILIYEPLIVFITQIYLTLIEPFIEMCWVHLWIDNEINTNWPLWFVLVQTRCVVVCCGCWYNSDCYYSQVPQKPALRTEKYKEINECLTKNIWLSDKGNRI